MLVGSFQLDEGITGKKNTLTINSEECISNCLTGDTPLLRAWAYKYPPRRTS